MKNNDIHDLHNAIEALGSMRSIIPSNSHARKFLMKRTKKELCQLLIDLRWRADQGLILKSEEQTGSSRLYRIDLELLESLKR